MNSPSLEGMADFTDTTLADDLSFLLARADVSTCALVGVGHADLAARSRSAAARRCSSVIVTRRLAPDAGFH